MTLRIDVLISTRLTPHSLRIDIHTQEGWPLDVVPKDSVGLHLKCLSRFEAEFSRNARRGTNQGVPTKIFVVSVCESSVA
jgi:hypothetical protein